MRNEHGTALVGHTLLGSCVILLAVAMLVGCQQEEPQSGLDRFIAQQRALPPAEYESSLRSLAQGDAPESVWAHYELGNYFYTAAGESASAHGWKEGPAPVLLDSAMIHFEQAVMVDSTFVEAYVNLGSLWDDLADQTGMQSAERRLREERLANAEKMYKKALAIAPTDEKALCNLGSLYMKNRKVGEAVAQFSRALEENPHSALAHYNLAIAFAEEKIYREAILEWEAAVAADPDGDIGGRSRENIKIVQGLINASKPGEVGGKKTSSLQ